MDNWWKLMAFRRPWHVFIWDSIPIFRVVFLFLIFLTGYLIVRRDISKYLAQKLMAIAGAVIVFGVIAYLMSAGQGASLGFLLFVSLSCNLMSFLFVSLFALWSAHVSFERGLNPDNIVIPAITSLSDTTATVAVNPAIYLAQLLGF